MARVPEVHRHRLPLRPRPPPGDEARHRPAPRDRHPHASSTSSARSPIPPARATACSACTTATCVPRWPQAAAALGAKRLFVVHGLDGLDEITTTGPTRVAEVKDGVVTTYEIKPGDFGMPTAAQREDLAGGDAAENAAHHPQDPCRREGPAPRHRPAERRRGHRGRAEGERPEGRNRRWRPSPSTPAPRSRSWRSWWS